MDEDWKFESRIKIKIYRENEDSDMVFALVLLVQVETAHGKASQVRISGPIQN
jgi:hypothetical protein